jgi:hypothetical protein
MGKVIVGWLGTLFLLAQALIASGAQVTICSFNIQFLGHFKNRSNHGLAEVQRG